MREKVQIGVVAYRDADGNFMPEKPIYRDSHEAEAEDEYMMDRLAELFYKKYKEYLEKTGKAGKESEI